MSDREAQPEFPVECAALPEPYRWSVSLDPTRTLAVLMRGSVPVEPLVYAELTSAAISDLYENGPEGLLGHQEVYHGSYQPVALKFAPNAMLAAEFRMLTTHDLPVRPACRHTAELVSYVLRRAKEDTLADLSAITERIADSVGASYDCTEKQLKDSARLIDEARHIARYEKTSSFTELLARIAEETAHPGKLPLIVRRVAREHVGQEWMHNAVENNHMFETVALGQLSNERITASELADRPDQSIIERAVKARRTDEKARERKRDGREPEQDER